MNRLQLHLLNSLIDHFNNALVHYGTLEYQTQVGIRECRVTDIRTSSTGHIGIRHFKTY